MKLKEAIKIACETISPRKVRNVGVYINGKRVNHTNTRKQDLSRNEAAHKKDD